MIPVSPNLNHDGRNRKRLHTLFETNQAISNIRMLGVPGKFALLSPLLELIIIVRLSYATITGRFPHGNDAGEAGIYIK
jgi:hypothetical protein